MNYFAAFSLLPALLLPHPSSAAALTFGGTVALTSNYLSDGLSNSENRGALQFAAEFGQDGFYAGVFASQVRDENDNRAALDLSAGYRAELASGLGYDIGITQSFRDKTGADGTELYGSLLYPLSDQLTVTGEASYDLIEKTAGGSLSAEYAVADGWGISAIAGQTDPASSPFWGISLSHDFTPATTVALDYQDTATTRGLAALTLSYKFGHGGE